MKTAFDRLLRGLGLRSPEHSGGPAAAAADAPASSDTATPSGPAPVAEEPKGIALDFDKIYRENIFGSSESVSGEGSELGQTARLREELPALLRRLGVKTLLDLPCGDFNWMGHVDLTGVHYIGGDVVEEIARNNAERHTADGREFLHLDLINDDLPRADLVFCRDCLVHLPYGHALKAIENVRRSGAVWFATTTFTRRHTNTDLYGVWRPLNLRDAPFNFPEPEVLVEEGCPPVEGLDFSDKSMGFWRVADLPVNADADRFAVVSGKDATA